MSTFADYRDGPGGEVAQTILGKSISHLTTWAGFAAFTYSVSSDRQEARDIIERARTAYSTGHIGERAVILASLFAMDRSRQAIMLETEAGENLLHIMNYVDDAHRRSVAACLLFGD
jgi:hypothetical protein